MFLSKKSLTILVSLFLFVCSSLIIGFFLAGWKGIVELTAITVGKVPKTPFQIYTLFIEKPAYILSAIEIAVWVIILSLDDFSKNPELLYRTIAAFIIINGLMIWFYAIF